VWAMSPGEALDAVIVDVDARERVNVSGAPAHVEHAGLWPEPDDLKATDEAWPFAPPPRPPRFDRQDFADAGIADFCCLSGDACPNEFQSANTAYARKPKRDRPSGLLRSRDGDECESEDECSECRASDGHAISSRVCDRHDEIRVLQRERFGAAGDASATRHVALVSIASLLAQSGAAKTCP
jgi:hypothetical protein